MTAIIVVPAVISRPDASSKSRCFAIRGRGERFRTRLASLDADHSCSCATRDDPANTDDGLLPRSNDDVIQAGSGLRSQPHQGMESVTWVLDGEREHKESFGNK